MEIIIIMKYYYNSFVFGPIVYCPPVALQGQFSCYKRLGCHVHTTSIPLPTHLYEMACVDLTGSCTRSLCYSSISMIVEIAPEAREEHERDTVKRSGFGHVPVFFTRPLALGNVCGYFPRILFCERLALYAFQTISIRALVSDNFWLINRHHLYNLTESCRVCLDIFHSTQWRMINAPQPRKSISNRVVLVIIPSWEFDSYPRSFYLYRYFVLVKVQWTLKRTTSHPRSSYRYLCLSIVAYRCCKLRTALTSNNSSSKK